MSLLEDAPLKPVHEMLHVSVTLPCVLEEKIMLCARDKYQVASTKVAHKRVMKDVPAAAIQMDRNRDGDQIWNVCYSLPRDKWTWFYEDNWRYSLILSADRDECEPRTWFELQFGQVWSGDGSNFDKRPKSRAALFKRGPGYLREMCKQYDIPNHLDVGWQYRFLHGSA
jgi:hypothetical protein